MAESTTDPMKELATVAAEVTEARNADLFYYSGSIELGVADQFRNIVLCSQSRPNALLLLTTSGGSGDAAYLMARCLQESYQDGTVAVLISTYCKSAGTLLTLGAKQVIMSDLAELGPLDVQIVKLDTLGERTSGLTPAQSLATLRREAFNCFEDFFLNILEASGQTISIRTAAGIAARATTGLMRPVYAQIDPMRLGEFERNLLVAQEYGKRLDFWARNPRDRALVQLVSGYPSHEFVIDRREALTLFYNVSPPSEAESDLASLATQCIRRTGGADAVFRYLSPSPSDGPEDGTGTPPAPPGAGEAGPRTVPVTKGDRAGSDAGFRTSHSNLGKGGKTKPPPGKAVDLAPGE